MRKQWVLAALKIGESVNINGKVCTPRRGKFGTMLYGISDSAQEGTVMVTRKLSNALELLGVC